MTYSWGPPHMIKQRQDDQQEPTYNSSVLIQDVALKTSWKQWTIEKGGGRGSGRSILIAWHDNDDDDDDDDDLYNITMLQLLSQFCLYIWNNVFITIIHWFFFKTWHSQYLLLLSGYPCKYWTGSSLLDFSELVIQLVKLDCKSAFHILLYGDLIEWFMSSYVLIPINNKLT